MNERERQEYLAEYKKEKEKGVPFFPDALYKDAIVSLAIFLILVALAFFLGTPTEPRADPSDTTYTPRPEWYFLFLFQLLKYFPGELEVVGVFVIPTALLILLFALPLLDRGNQRHFRRRPIVTGATAALMFGVVLLTAQALLEAPPPLELGGGDRTAALYTENCAACHGGMVVVPEGANLHEVIAQGSHEGMPAWSGDLTSDEIDALAGFIVSPAGSLLFVQYCEECHQTAELVAGNPLELKDALELGPDYPSHAELSLPDFSAELSSESRNALLNFLVAPDGQRLFSVNCSTCHGRSVPVRGEPEELRTIISQGGLHLEMPPWRERLSDSELDALARYVVDPSAAPEAVPLYEQHCVDCHASRVPAADSVDEAREIIAFGGSHETMPVWGEVLTDAQLDALVSYALDAASGSPVEVGRELFAQNCSPCHGDFGEGGPNPSRTNDIIAPISTAEYLRTRDDSTLRAIISGGQPNFGMSPFSTSFGGPLDDSDINAIVAFLRAWEANPPVELPPEIPAQPLTLSGDEIYAEVCAQCHAADGSGLIGPSLRDPAFQSSVSDQELFDSINLGHEATSMIGWGEVLNAEQVNQLVDFIRGLAAAETAATAGPVSFASDVLPILEARCTLCHGIAGGWDASSYDTVMNTGDSAPVVIPGDPEASLLAKKILGTQDAGALMPPGGALPARETQIILAWIAAGALDN